MDLYHSRDILVSVEIGDEINKQVIGSVLQHTCQ